MKTYDKPKRPEETRSAEETLQLLIERYRTSRTEAKGILHAIADLCDPVPPAPLNVDAVHFLILAGDESKNWEPEAFLRREARKLLYRYPMRKMLLLDDKRPRTREQRQTEVLLMHDLLMFLGNVDENAPSDESDKGLATLFLKRSWEVAEAQRIRWDHLVGASITCGYFDELEPRYEDINNLYWSIYRAVQEEHRKDLPDRACPIDPVGTSNAVVTDSAMLLAGRVLSMPLYSGFYGRRAEKLLSLRAEWLVREGDL